MQNNIFNLHIRVDKFSRKIGFNCITKNSNRK